MARNSFALLTRTVDATAAITAGRFVTNAGAVAAAAGRALGVARTNAASGERFPADVIGTAVMEAGGAIAVDAAIEVDANGKGVTIAAGVPVARALEAAAADGDMIEVLLIPN